MLMTLSIVTSVFVWAALMAFYFRDQTKEWLLNRFSRTTPLHDPEGTVPEPISFRAARPSPPDEG